MKLQSNMYIYKYKYNKKSNLVPSSKHHSRSNFKVGLPHSTLITVLTLLLETYFRQQRIFDVP